MNIIFPPLQHVQDEVQHRACYQRGGEHKRAALKHAPDSQLLPHDNERRDAGEGHGEDDDGDEHLLCRKVKRNEQPHRDIFAEESHYYRYGGGCRQSQHRLEEGRENIADPLQQADGVEYVD